MSYTPLVTAIASGKVSKVNKILAKKNPKINDLGTIGMPALVIAVQQVYEGEFAAKKAVEMVASILAHRDCDVNLQTASGYSALYNATQHQRTNARCLRLLLAHPDIDPNQVSVDDGATPLCIAAMNGNLEAVTQLVAHDSINVNRARKSGFTPLLFAIQNHQVNIVQILLNHAHIDVNKMDSAEFQRTRDLSQPQGVSPLYLAAHNGDEDPTKLEILQLLLNHPRIKVNQRSKRGSKASSMPTGTF